MYKEDHDLANIYAKTQSRMSTIKEDRKCNALALGHFFVAIKPTQDSLNLKEIELRPVLLSVIVLIQMWIFAWNFEDIFIRSWSFFYISPNKIFPWMHGAGTAPLKLAIIFKSLLFHVLIEAWRTEISVRYGWDELTEHNQSQRTGSMIFVRPLWVRSNILITCMCSVKLV